MELWWQSHRITLLSRESSPARNAGEVDGGRRKPEARGESIPPLPRIWRRHSLFRLGLASVNHTNERNPLKSFIGGGGPSVGIGSGEGGRRKKKKEKEKKTRFQAEAANPPDNTYVDVEWKIS